MTLTRTPGRRLGAHPFALALLAAAALLAPAAEPKTAAPAPTAASAVADRQDFVYLGPGGPLRLRFHVYYAGRPVSDRWSDYCDQLFKHFDSDGNGSLDAKEFARLAAFPLGGNVGRAMPEPAAEDNSDADERPAGSPEADTNKDGKVTPDELRAYLRRRGLGPVLAQVLPPAGDSEALTDALFKRLDADRDGELSKAEVDAAVRVLARLDLDEDEMLTRAELLEQPPAAPRSPVPVREEADGSGQSDQRGDFLARAPGDSPAATAKQLLARLAKGKSNKLSRKESGFDAERFAALDRNGDGKLDADELAAWLGQRPDLEYRVDFGEVPLPTLWVSAAAAALRQPVSTWSPETPAAALAARVRTGADRALRLELPGAVLGVTPEAVLNPPVRPRGNNAFLLDQLRGLAGDKKVIERDQLQMRPELQVFAALFESIDRNGDGKLQLDEATSFIRLADAGAERQAVLSVSDRGRGIFELLDTDGDGRLSVRELRNAWKVLSVYAGEGKQAITREQVPHGYTVRPEMTALGSSANFSGLVFAADVGGPTGVVIPAEGPEWFRKMDRNGDGDVSPREWVGPPELFRKLDKDGDGLISRQEAIEAERGAKAGKK